MTRKLTRRLAKPCEKCILSWETRSHEGDCDCGCVLYRDLEAGRLACLLPNFMLAWYRHKKDQEYGNAMAREAEGMAKWFDISSQKDRLFLEALQAKLFVDSNKNPKQPLYRSHNGGYYPYAPTDMWAKARMDFDENLRSGMPPIKAFQKAVSEYATPELFYEAGPGQYEAFQIFANCQAALDEYLERLKQAGLDEGLIL